MSLFNEEKWLVKIDNKGHAPALFMKWRVAHWKLAPIFEFEFVNNQPSDVEAWRNGKLEAAFELKLEEDLDSSLKNGRLMAELQGYTSRCIEQGCNRIYLICGGTYEPKVYSWLIGLMNGKFPWIQFHTKMSTSAAIDKVLELIRRPPILPKEFIPALVRTSDKSFALSIASLMDGISEALANDLSKTWYYEITESEIQDIINIHYDDGKEHGALANKIYNKWMRTWNRERPKSSKIFMKNTTNKFSEDINYEKIQRRHQNDVRNWRK